MQIKLVAYHAGWPSTKTCRLSIGYCFAPFISSNEQANSMWCLKIDNWLLVISGKNKLDYRDLIRFQWLISTWLWLLSSSQSIGMTIGCMKRVHFFHWINTCISQQTERTNFGFAPGEPANFFPSLVMHIHLHKGGGTHNTCATIRSLTSLDFCGSKFSVALCVDSPIERKRPLGFLNFASLKDGDFNYNFKFISGDRIYYHLFRSIKSQSRLEIDEWKRGYQSFIFFYWICVTIIVSLGCYCYKSRWTGRLTDRQYGDSTLEYDIILSYNQTENTQNKIRGCQRIPFTHFNVLE